MFDRVQYKAQAKAQLKNNWKTPILITLTGAAVLLVWDALFFANSFARQIMQKEIFDFPPIGYSQFIFFTLGLSVLGFCFLAALKMAYARYFVVFTARREQATFSAFLEGFSLWGKGIGATLWSILWVILWSFLFYIPGIIKMIAYSQMFYILAEYPKLSVRKAMRISIAMTKGYKGDLFVMYLSFFGWALLATLSLYIGYLWLIPYMESTQLYAYRYLKETALKTGVLKPEDFGVVPTYTQG